MLALVVVAVVLAVVLVLQEPLERLGSRLDERPRSAPPPQRRRARLHPARLHPRHWDLEARRELRRQRRLPVLPAEDRPPRSAGAAPASPRALGLELRRGLDELTLHLALHALQQRRSPEDAEHRDPSPPAAPQREDAA